MSFPSGMQGDPPNRAQRAPGDEEGENASHGDVSEAEDDDDDDGYHPVGKERAAEVCCTEPVPVGEAPVVRDAEGRRLGTRRLLLRLRRRMRMMVRWRKRTRQSRERRSAWHCRGLSRLSSAQLSS